MHTVTNIEVGARLCCQRVECRLIAPALEITVDETINLRRGESVLGDETAVPVAGAAAVRVAVLR